MLLIQRDMFRRLVVGAALTTMTLGLAELLATTQPLTNYLAAGALTPREYALALLCALPTIIYLAGAVTSAAALSYLYHEWARHHQIVALRMAGLSDRAIAAPAIAAGVVAAAIVASMSLYFVPVSARVVSDIRYAALKRLTLEVLQPGQMQSITPEYSIWFRGRTEAGILQEVVVIDGRKPDHPSYVFASRGYVVPPAERGSEPALLLADGTQMVVDEGSREVKFVSLQHLVIPLMSLAGARNGHGFFEEHIGALLDPPPDIRADRNSFAAWLEEGHRRIIMPLLALSYTIFALGVMLRGDPRSRAYRVIAIVLGIGLWHALIVVSHSLVANAPEAIPAYYAAALVPALIGGAMLRLWRLRSPALPVASDPDLVPS